MKKVRFGVVGLGVMGRRHAEVLATRGGRSFCLTAVADNVSEVSQEVARTRGVEAFTEAEAMYASGLIDAVLVARFDRFARSTRHLVIALEEFDALGIDFISLSESVDTSTPMGKMVI